MDKGRIARKAVEEQLKAVEEDRLEQAEKMTKLERLNAKVVDVGLHYYGHYRDATIRFEFALSDGGHVCMTIDPKTCDYSVLFDDVFDIDSENGVYLEALKGHPCCCWLDESGKLKYISNFLDDDKMISLEEK